MRSTKRQRAGIWMGGMLLLAAGTAAPVWGQQVIVPPAPVLVTSPVVTVNNTGGNQTDPHVSKDLVSYTDDSIGSTIRYYRFSTGVHSIIPPGPNAFDTLSDVSGDVISFSRHSSDRRALMVFNTATLALKEIAPQVGTRRFVNALGGNTLAFVDCSTFPFLNCDIMAYDLVENKLTNVSASPFFDGNPNVAPDGNTIVWEHCLSITDCDIAKAVQSGGAWTVSSVAATLENEGNPDTDGVRIVYDSERASPTGNDIYFQPVGGGTETRLALAGAQRNPSLSQGVIAFESANGNVPADIFVYVLATNTLYQVTATPTVHESLTDVTVLDNGDIRVVWAANDGVGGDENIYATTFTPFVFPLQRTLYGVNSDDDGLSAINPTTGLIRFIGPLSQDPNRFVTPVAMAVRPGDEKLFVWNNSRIDPGTGATLRTGELLTVDTCSALATPVLPGTPPPVILGALAFAPDGRLFGSADGFLMQIDPATGVATQVGSALGLRIGGADFTPDGQLYGVELVCGGIHPSCPTQQRLVRIDTGTGMDTIVATLSQNIGNIGSIVFNPATGKFLGSSDREASGGALLFDLDTTGMVSNVRPMSGGSIAQGLGFAPTCITGSIADILTFFDDAATSGSLVGTGSGQSGAGRLGALRNMIQTAGELLSQGNSAQACQLLKNALDRTDGNPNPPDLVSGADAATLAALLRNLRAGLGCG